VKTRVKWELKSLDELGFVGRGKSRHRPRNDPALYDGSYPFIQTAQITESDLYITRYEQTYSEIGLAQSKMWDEGTLCIVNAGVNTGDTSILKFKSCFPDSVIAFVADPHEADVRFVKYYLDTIKPRIRSITRGATQDNLSVDKLLSFKIPTPQLRVQGKIASILSAYDDLIENNTRRIKILEDMAQLIYREWFVNFRFPGHEQVKIVDSELGEIPEGWEVKKLGEVIELSYGKALKADNRVTGDFPVYGSAGIVGYHNKSLVKAPGIIVGRKGNVGSVFWSDDDFFPIDTVFYVKTDLSLHYAYYNLQRQNFINNDAAVPGLSRNQAYTLPLLVPDADVSQNFQMLIDVFFKQTKNLNEKNTNLRQTRDLLLPRLISGEIDVENLDIDTGVEEDDSW
jgi:type I restriction enzyme S subunit